MRAIKYTSRFKRDYRREKSGQHGKALDTALLAVSIIPCLVNGRIIGTAISSPIWC